jgi:hypothetical protein
LRGGPRVLLLSDPTSGKSITLGTIRSSQGEILPPNEVVYRACFEGIEADVVYVWKKGGLSQNVVLREAIVLPEGWSADSRIEVVTEFVEAPQPDVRAQVFKAEGLPDRVDAGFIVFGWMAALPGVAYAVEGGANLTGSAGVEGGSVPVAKQWIPAQGAVGALLIASVSYGESAAYLKDLPKLEARVEAGDRVVEERRVALARAGDRTGARSLEAGNRTGAPRPMQLAAAGAAIRRGYLIDVELSGTVASKTFLHYTGSDGTYWICNSYTVTSGATFNDGAIIKYANNAYLQLSGSVSAPAYGLVQLTSIHDNSVGATILTGNCTSSGDPFVAGQTALHALRIYGPPASTTLRNFRICFAKTGVNYYSSLSHTMEKMRFEHCQTGVSAYAASVTISNVVQCDTYALTSNQGGGASFTTSNVSTDCAFYVPPAGDDNNLATIGSPWKPLAKAKQVSGPKVTVILRAGTYAENLDGDWYGGLKSWSYPSTLKGYTGERPVLRPNAGAPHGRVITFGIALANPRIGPEAMIFIVIENLVLDAVNLSSDGVKVQDGASLIRIKNCEIKNAYSQGILVAKQGDNDTGGQCEFLQLNIHHWGRGPYSLQEHAIYVQTPSNLVDQCFFWDGPSHGFHAYTDPGFEMHNKSNVCRNSLFFRCGKADGGSAAGLYRGVDLKLHNNVFFDCSRNIIRAGNNLTGAEIHANTIFGTANTTGKGIEVGVDGSAQNVKIFNNIVHACNQIGVHIGASAALIELKNNLAFTNGMGAGIALEEKNFYIQPVSGVTRSGNIPLDYDPCGAPDPDNFPGCDPLFENPVADVAAVNLRLKANRWALNQGLTIPGLTEDYSGPVLPNANHTSSTLTLTTPATRGSPPDIGAYERP